MPFSPPELLARVVSILVPAFNEEKNIVTPSSRAVAEYPRYRASSAQRRSPPSIAASSAQRRSAPSIAASAARSRRRSAAVSFFCALLHL
jgi:hypothetical protein